MTEQTHTVQAHLGIDAAGYDTAIRRFVPHYDEMLAVTVGTVASALLHTSPASGRREPEIIELGAGTGAVIDALAAQIFAARFTAIDCDPQMLATARARLAQWQPRVRFVQARFADGLAAASSVEVIVASLALHHERDLRAKTKLYRRIFSTLSPGGFFVNADVTLAAAGLPRGLALDAWVAHQTASGIPESEARRQLEKWQREEDRYFTIDEELGALAEAGFSACDVVWRRGPMTVLLAAREQ